MVLSVVLKIFSRSVGEQLPGVPLSAHVGGALGMVVLVPKNSHTPVSVPLLRNADCATVNPLSVMPGAKRLAGIACPVGDNMRLIRGYESGTLSAD